VARWVRRHAVTDRWAGAGIRLNAVAPGLTDTAMVAEGRADATLAPLLDAFPVPRGRAASAGEVAAVIGFLLGPDAACCCGSVVFADGGSDAQLRPDDWPVPWSP
jgi:NAD(P)-dependent dehydrogenase (short-subunit alcohol dehydrogenase family)